ncbi:MAG: glycosyltransferase family 2 protein [Alphaproteobacteria bacterium]|nr:glycosyltransferase family 2 protein [Alphaproteobacteria bacterium]
MKIQNKTSEKIPISVLVITKNEEARIARCLDSVSAFSEVIVIDSQSSDRTREIAKKYNAKVVDFIWNKSYPKKRQWCINTQNIGYDWIFWLDADEVVTTRFLEEIRDITKNGLPYCGYFVKGQYVWKGIPLRHGLQNNKLALYHKSMVEFPQVDDLYIEGMGEIEGHFQPIKKQGYQDRLIGQIYNPILHYAYEDEGAWKVRHERYAHWEAQMIESDAYPKDPVLWRERLKRLTRRSHLKPFLMFIYSYVFKLGFLDGKAGLDFALSRKSYCDMVIRNLTRS